MAKQTLDNIGLIQAKAIELLRFHNPSLVFQGFAYLSTPAPGTHTANHAWIAAENATIFGLSVTKGQVIRDNGSAYIAENSIQPNKQNISVIDAYGGELNNVEVDGNKLILKKEGLSIVYRNTYKTLTGAADYEFTASGTRKYLYLNIRFLRDNAASLLDYTTSGLLIQSTDALINEEDYVLMAGFYNSELQSGVGLLSAIINKVKLINKVKNNLAACYMAGVPNGMVEFDTTLNTIKIPASFTLVIDGVKFATTALQTVPVICTTYPEGAQATSSAGFLVMNLSTKQVLNVYHADFYKLGTKWALFGIVKRNASAASPVGPIQVTGNFRYTIDGLAQGIIFPDIPTRRYMMNPSLYVGSTNSVIVVDTAGNTITFPVSFSVWAYDGQKYTTTAEQIVPLVCTTYTTWAPSASSMGVLIINKTTKEIRNLLHSQWNTSMSDSWITFGVIKRDTAALSPVGKVQVIAQFPYVIDGKTYGNVYEVDNNILNNTRVMFPGFVFNSSADLRVNVNRTAMLIEFPANFNVFGNNKTGVRIRSIDAQNVSLCCTDINGTLLTSSLGALIMHKTTGAIVHLIWSTYDSTFYADYVFIGIVKRTSASTTIPGTVQLICNFPYTIDGVIPGGTGSVVDGVVSRNADVQSLAIAALYPTQTSSSIVKRFNFLWTTDIHNDLLTTQNFITYLNSRPEIDNAIVTGDIAAGNFAEDFIPMKTILQKANVPIYTLAGNHDCGNSKTIALCGTNAEVYTKFIEPFETAAGMITAGKNYWYKDIAAHKIRLIALYEFDDPNDVNGSVPTEYKIMRGARVFSQAQINWFIALLNATPADYAVLVALHQVPTKTTAELSINTNWKHDGGTIQCYSLINGDIINDIIEAWRTGASINETYTFSAEAAYLPAITAVGNFTARGTGEFITYIFGHNHKDGAGTFVNYPNQTWITATCGIAEPASVWFSDLPRVRNTKTEDAFNLVSIDRTEKKIYIVRIGSNIANDFKERKKVVLQYAAAPAPAPVPMSQTNLLDLGFSSYEIDSRLNYLAGTGTAGVTIDIRGNDPRTEASDADFATLVELSCIILEDV